MHPSAELPLFSSSSSSVSFWLCRYLCNEHIKLGPDIVSNNSYKEQFDAVEQCFKVIGFTLEVNTIKLKNKKEKLESYRIIKPNE